MDDFLFVTPSTYDDWLRTLGCDPRDAEVQRHMLRRLADRSTWLPQRFNVPLPASGTDFDGSEALRTDIFGEEWDL